MPRPSLAPLLLPLLIGCASSATGNMDLSLRVVEDRPDASARVQAPDAGGAVFELDQARAIVRHIRIDLPEDLSCEDLDDDTGSEPCEDDTIEITGPFEIDLMTGVSEPPLDSISLPTGVWERVDVRFDDGEDGALDDNTLVASGTAHMDSGEVPFELALKFNEDVRFESPEGVSFEDGDGVLLGLDAGGWFDTVPLADCAEDGDLELDGGVLLIEDGDGDCNEVEGAIKEAMKRSGDLDRE